MEPQTPALWCPRSLMWCALVSHERTRSFTIEPGQWYRKRVGEHAYRKFFFLCVNKKYACLLGLANACWKFRARLNACGRLSRVRRVSVVLFDLQVVERCHASRFFSFGGAFGVVDATSTHHVAPFVLSNEMLFCFALLGRGLRDRTVLLRHPGVRERAQVLSGQLGKRGAAPCYVP